MRVILLSYHIPPGQAVGGLRAAKVADALVRAGHSVHVITAALPGEAPSTREAGPGLTIETVTPWVSPRFWYLKLRGKLAGANPSGTTPVQTAEEASPAEGPEPAAWKRLISSFLWLPDDKQGFIPPAFRAALKEIRIGADLLYTTVPPFSTALAGLCLKQWTGIRWVLEFRDPWTDSQFRLKAAKSGPSIAVNRWLEASCLKRADHIIVVSEGLQRLLAPKLPRMAPGKVSVVLNGIEQLRPHASRHATSGPYRVVHLGSLYHRRDPFPFLRAVADLRRSGQLPARGMTIELVGKCHEYKGASLVQAGRELGIEDLLAFRPWVPHAEARRLAEEADLLLLLAQDQPDQIPNKLFDYLGAGPRILAFTDQDGETGRMLKEAGGHIVVSDSNGTAIVAALREALSDTPSMGGVKRGVLESWSTERQMSKLLAVLTESAEPA